MNLLKTVGLIGIGMVVAALLIYGVDAVRAQGPGGMMGRMGGMMMGGDMSAMHAQMQNGDMQAMHAQMGGSMQAMHENMSTEDMAAMHAQMHDGEAMPTECLAMMDDPAMQQHMTDMMAGGEHMTLEEAQEWMEEAGVPADVQVQCLDHMALHHPSSE